MNVISAKDIYQVCTSTANVLGQDGMVAALRIPDLDYVCLSEDGVREFGARFENFLRTSGLDRYAEERNDCDEYALHATSCVKIDHARNHPGEEALAFGIAWVMTDTLVHAVNAVIHLDDIGKPYLKLCEPQITWNDRKQIGVPYVTMREFPLASVRSWQLLCF